MSLAAQKIRLPEFPAPRSSENVYLPKVAVLDRVVPEIADVKTFYWHL